MTWILGGGGTGEREGKLDTEGTQNADKSTEEMSIPKEVLDRTKAGGKKEGGQDPTGDDDDKDDEDEKEDEK